MRANQLASCPACPEQRRRASLFGGFTRRLFGGSVAGLDFRMTLLVPP